MKVLQINSFGNLSTGKVAVDIARTLKENGDDCRIAYARNTVPKDISGIKIGNMADVYIHGMASRVTDKAGFYSSRATKDLLKKIDSYNPDIIHLHNLHGYYINIDILFRYIKKEKKAVVWTLHDCWSFTGHCCNFESISCDKWRNQCQLCPQKTRYPASYIFDHSKWNYTVKRNLFTGIEDMTLVTPSMWLKELVHHSFMNEYPVEIIRNGIDLNVFKPTTGKWVFNNHLENKKIILGVAGEWTPTKGLEDILKIADKLSDDYQVVVVGLHKREIRAYSSMIFGIEKTYDNRELAEIYTAAHCLINPTYDDNFPTINLEALGCGTPVIMYKTGGGPEILTDSCGKVVEKGDINGMLNAITTIKKDSNACIDLAKKFERGVAFRKYLDLYTSIIMRKRK